jgi:hypothetical protein
MRLYDNTRVKSYRSCPRRYYFRHVRHWVGTGKSAPLIFGSAWHSAMDALWKGASERKSQETTWKNASAAFVQKWLEEGYEFPLDLAEEQALSPKTPGNAVDMLQKYIEARWEYILSVDVLSIEKPFAVPLDDSTRFAYVGKIDKVVVGKEGVLAIEHKTTGVYRVAGDHFAQEFVDSFNPNAQVDGYIHALHMEYGKKTYGARIDAALTHKKQRAFKFIPVLKAIASLQEWLNDTKQWIAQIENDRKMLTKQRAKGPGSQPTAMEAFRKNTDNCFEFFRPCPYLDICRFHSNPDTLTDAPEWLKVDPWNPVKELQLEKLGITEDTDEVNT